jgi:hypothetical protein
VIPIRAPRVCSAGMNPESSIDYAKGESAVPITTRADLLPFPLRFQSLSVPLKHYGGVKSDANHCSLNQRHPVSSFFVEAPLNDVGTPPSLDTCRRVPCLSRVVTANAH